MVLEKSDWKPKAMLVRLRAPALLFEPLPKKVCAEAEREGKRRAQASTLCRKREGYEYFIEFIKNSFL